MMRRKKEPMLEMEPLQEVKNLEATKTELSEAVQEAKDTSQHLHNLLLENHITIKIFVDGFGGKVRKKKVA